MASDLPYIAVSAFDIIAIAATVGALATRLWIIPKGTDDLFHRPVWRLLGWALGLVTTSSLVLLAGRTLEMSRAPWMRLAHWLPLVLTDTPFGHIWSVRPAVLILAWIAWARGWRADSAPGSARVILVAMAAIAFTRSATGHPVDQGQWQAPEWVDFVHLMAGAVWAGTVFAMTLVVFPRLKDKRISSPVRAALIGNLSSVATVALIIVLVTGLLSAYHYLGSLAALWGSTYGHTLLVKLAFVGLAILLGAANRFILVPRIRAQPYSLPAESSRPAPAATGVTAFRWLTGSVALEAVLLCAVLLAAATLLHGMPPREMAMAMRGGTMARAGQDSKTRGHASEASLVGPGDPGQALPVPLVRYGVLAEPRSRSGKDHDGPGFLQNAIL